MVVLETSKGIIRLELTPEKTPVTVENFVRYVKDGHLDGTIFHRVVPGFVIQGGGFTEDFTEKPTREPIENEAALGIKNVRGTISMARTRERNSATSQFFISLKDNDMLDYRGEHPSAWGYAAFGRVIEGMDVVDTIAAIPTVVKGPFDRPEVPSETVLILKATVQP
ncbi:MAG: peptidylprolyl isomerase [Deltaproteobacteria bacterium]|nr:peptidylprolyl isomerase [Deltaproteobacteria bacterium]